MPDIPAIRIPFTWTQPALPTKNILGASQPPWKLPENKHKDVTRERRITYSSHI